MRLKLYLSLGLLSAAVIAYQLILMQVLSITQWYHFAYMVISVAMLGFGFSGTLLAVSRKWFIGKADIILPLTMMLSGVSMASLLPVTRSLLGGFDTYLLFVDNSQIGMLIATYAAYLIPFFFAALGIGLIFIRFVPHIGHLYFSNLTGSGIGGLAALFLLRYFFPDQLPAIIALLPVSAGLILIPSAGRKIFISVFCVSVLIITVLIFRPAELVMSEYKSVSRTLTLPGAIVEKERASAHGLVQVVSSDALRYAPALSLAYRDEIQVRKAVFNNGEWFGQLVSWTRGDTAHMLDYSTEALPYETGARRRILVLNAGTGEAVSHALVRGAEKITAVEPNSPVVSMMMREYVSETDSLFLHSAVDVRMMEPRTYLKLVQERYDLITLPTIDAFGGTAGIYAMREQYLLTREAFREMWNLLSPEGMISITSWMDYPVRNPLKILATLVELLELEQIGNIEEHLIAIRSWGTVSFFLKRSPVTDDEIEAIRSFCGALYFDPLLLPGLRDEERTRYNDIEDRSFFKFVDMILSEERENLYSEYDFNIRPATDDRPYFSQFLRWKSLPRLRELFGDRVMPFLEAGYLIVAVTFLQILIAAVVLIILPLLRIGFRGGGKGWTVLYFSGLGLGFMFIEIVMIQRFILYLGQPIYSAAAVIAALLICSGIGSYLSSRYSPDKKSLRSVTGAVVVLTLLYILILPPVMDLTISLPLAVKGLVSFIILAPPALMMGMPFPLGLRYVASRNESHVPWAWGINGCLSVVSTVLAVIIAVEFGFTAVMLCAAAAYGIAFSLNLRSANR